MTLYFIHVFVLFGFICMSFCTYAFLCFLFHGFVSNSLVFFLVKTKLLTKTSSYFLIQIGSLFRQLVGSWSLEHYIFLIMLSFDTYTECLRVRVCVWVYLCDQNLLFTFLST